MSLRDTFSDDFSSSAFVRDVGRYPDGRPAPGHMRIIGKFCEIELLDDSYPGYDDPDKIYDIWLVSRSSGREASYEPMTTRKLNSLVKGIKQLPSFSRTAPPIAVLDGEAYLQTTDSELVREVAFYAGVKRRKRYSEATKKANRERLANYRRTG